MGIDTRQARRALKSSGARGLSLLSRTWPFGRNGRLRELLRRRLAVVETKNAVCDLLFPLQRPVTDYHVDTLARAREFLGAAENRRLLARAAQTRTVIEEELSHSVGIELGSTLDVALTELVAEGVLLHVPGREVLAQEDVYLLTAREHCPRQETAELKRLVQAQGTGADLLRHRERRRSTTDGSRSYDL